MGFFKWKEEFSVHDPDMDKHHREFFNLLNEMYEYNERQSRDPEFLNRLFRDLSDYVLVHFMEEEKLLDQVKFEGLEEQKSQHRYFKDQLVKLREEHFTDQAAVPARVFIFMRDWLLTHVLEMDQQYGRYLIEKSLK